MIVRTETITCDVCGTAVTTQMFNVYAGGKVHIHRECMHDLLQWVRDDPDKYMTAIQTNPDKHGLTIRHFIEDTDEHRALIKNTWCYLFIDNCDLGPYVCVCSNFFYAVPPVIRGLDNTREEILAAFIHGKFWSVETRITVSMDDEEGHRLIDPKEEEQGV